MCDITKRSLLVCVILGGFIGAYRTEHEVGNLSLSSPHTWREAVTDTTCPLVGSTLTGDVTTNTVNISRLDWSHYSRAWIGAHVERLIWINFEGCFIGYRRHFGVNTGWDLTSDPVKSCLNHCNNGDFVLTLSKCFCRNQVTINVGGCLATNCGNNRNQPFCGQASRPLIHYCMCRYSVLNTTVHGYGNCMTTTYRNYIPLYNATGCSSNHAHLCYDTSHPLRSRVFNKQESWYDSWRDCYKKNLQFLGLRNTTIRPNSGTFWIGVFAVPFIRWGIDKDNNTDQGCVAVIKTNNNHINIQPTVCNQKIPGVCVRSDVTLATTVSVLIPTAPTELITTPEGIRTPDVVTTTEPDTTSESRPFGITTEETTIPYLEHTTIPDILSQTQNGSGTSIPVIAGSVVGIVLLIILLVVGLVLRRRGILNNCPSRRDKIEMAHKNTYDTAEAGDEPTQNDVHYYNTASFESEINTSNGGHIGNDYVEVIEHDEVDMSDSVHSGICGVDGNYEKLGPKHEEHIYREID